MNIYIFLSICIYNDSLSASSSFHLPLLLFYTVVILVKCNDSVGNVAVWMRFIHLSFSVSAPMCMAIHHAPKNHANICIYLFSIPRNGREMEMRNFISIFNQMHSHNSLCFSFFFIRKWPIALPIYIHFPPNAICIIFKSSMDIFSRIETQIFPSFLSIVSGFVCLILF